MPVKFQFTDQRLQTWLLCHQTYDSVFKCEEAVFSKLGLTCATAGQCGCLSPRRERISSIRRLCPVGN